MPERMTYAGRFTVTRTFLDFLQEARPGTNWDKELKVGTVLPLFQETDPAPCWSTRYRLDGVGPPTHPGHYRLVGPDPCIVLWNHPGKCQPLGALHPRFKYGELIRDQDGLIFQVVRNEGYGALIVPVIDGKPVGVCREVDIHMAWDLRLYTLVTQPANSLEWVYAQRLRRYGEAISEDYLIPFRLADPEPPA